jgi:hypothetical protein
MLAQCKALLQRKDVQVAATGVAVAVISAITEYRREKRAHDEAVTPPARAYPPYPTASAGSSPRATISTFSPATQQRLQAGFAADHSALRVNNARNAEPGTWITIPGAGYPQPTPPGTWQTIPGRTV